MLFGSAWAPLFWWLFCPSSLSTSPRYYRSVASVYIYYFSPFLFFLFYSLFLACFFIFLPLVHLSSLSPPVTGWLGQRRREAREVRILYLLFQKPLSWIIPLSNTVSPFLSLARLLLSVHPIGDIFKLFFIISLIFFLDCFPQQWRKRPTPRKRSDRWRRNETEE